MTLHLNILIIVQEFSVLSSQGLELVKSSQVRPPPPFMTNYYLYLPRIFCGWNIFPSRVACRGLECTKEAPLFWETFQPFIKFISKNLNIASLLGAISWHVQLQEHSCLFCLFVIMISSACMPPTDLVFGLGHP